MKQNTVYRIFLVEDDKMLSEEIMKLLMQWGFQ
ncbi:MAG: hypothetical protein K0S30_2355, partial [Clostridia bacterium]|nr:hypothetical protein [Clostridia bacterium]